MSGKKHKAPHAFTISTPPTALLVIFFAVAYALLGAMGLMLAIPPGYASPVFPASGFALAFVLWYGRRVLLGAWIGSALLNMSHAWLGGTLNMKTAAVAALIAVGATFQAFAGSWLVERWQGQSWRDMEREQDVFGFLVLGGVLACLLSASISVTGLYATGIIEDTEFLFTWWNWYVGDVLGVLVFAPLTLCVLNRRDELWRERRRRIVLPMLVTLGLVAAAFYGAARWERQAQYTHLRDDGETIAGRIADRLISHREVLSSLRNFIEATPDFSFRQFEQFTRITLQDNHDIFALSFNDLVTREKRPEFERTMSRLSPLGSFQITERDSKRQLVPAALRPEYVTVRYIVPIANNEPAVGYDINSEPIRRDAINRARASKNMAVTSPIQLVQEQRKRIGILELAPVVNAPMAGARGAATEIAGFAVAVTKIDEMVQIATRGKVPAGLVFQLIDPHAPADQGLLYRSDASDANSKPLTSAPEWKTALRMGDRDWELSVFTAKSYRQQHRPWMAWVAGVAGLMFATLLQVLMLGMTGRTAVIERKSEALKTSEERYYRLFNDSPLPMWLYEAGSRRFLMVNHRAVAHYGWTEEAFLKMALPDILIPGDGPALSDIPMGQSIPENAAECRHIRPDGSVIDVVVHSSPAKFGDLDARLEVIQDITENKKNREQLLLADREKELAKAATKAKSEFLASMSHEIRTPMNAIIGMADLLLESPLTVEQAKYVNIFRNAGENLLHIINDILDFSKIEAGQIPLESIAFSLRGLLHELVDIMTFKAAEKGIALTCTVAQDVDDQLAGDPNRISQILLNLVGNALKFTDRGGVHISVEKVEDRPSDAEQSSDAVHLLFMVKDTGIGIPPQMVDTIFDKFTQADTSISRKFGGTGLGLAICRQLVKLMDGKLWVESAEGVGSTFCFNLSLKRGVQGSFADTSDRGPQTAANKETGATQSPLKILIVEDNEDNRLLLLSYVAKLPHSIQIAVNGAEAVEKIADGESYDIIFMDVQMPVMDGYTATGRIRSLESDRNLKPAIIVALTAHALKEDARKSIVAGCNGHLTKPIRKQEFLSALEVFRREIPSG